MESSQLIHDRNEIWTRIIHTLNKGNIDEAKMHYLESDYKGNEWEERALLAYLFAREKFEATDALRILKRITFPEQVSTEELPVVTLNAEYAILHGIIATNSFGKTEEQHLKISEYYLSKISQDGLNKLPLIQNLQINRIIATLLFNYEKFEKCLVISEETKVKWENMSEGNLNFSQDIPCLLNLIDMAKQKILEKNAHNERCRENQIKPINEIRSLIPNATIKLDFNRYVEKAKETSKRGKIAYNELWSEIAGNQKYEGATIIANQENKISYNMLRKLKLDTADLGILKNEYNDDIPRLPIIIERQILLSGDFIVSSDIKSEIEINPYLNDMVNNPKRYDKQT